MRRARRAGRGTLSCARVREEISAALDAESTSGHRGARRAHLKSCAECRRFAAEVGTLTSQVNLQSSRRAPEALKDLLAAELVRTGPKAEAAPRWSSRFGATAQWCRRVQWVGALAPAATLAVVLPLGPLSLPQGSPTHPSTPCTSHLRPVMPDGRTAR